MNTIGDIAFQTIAWAVVAACIIAIIVIAFAQWRRTRALPPELTRIDERPLHQFTFYFIVMANVFLHTLTPDHIATSIPMALLMATMSLSTFVALAALAGLAISESFRSTWNKQVGLRQTRFLIFSALLGYFFLRDVASYRSIAWIWIIAGLAACFLVPAFTRFAYLEEYLPASEPPEENPEPHVTIYRA